MSKSRSVTPTTNLLSPNISSSLESTSSRLDTHENPPLVHSFGERDQPSPSRSPPLHSFQALEPESDTSRSNLRRSAESSPDQPMAKRLRRELTEGRGRADVRSSPSSDSQGGMADTETEAGHNRHSETLPLATAPPKKKRTRTLTTPHQSAVLHALLSQSRFPTTAMREEVGRSIGLSARKVQIWFQNQRQKARRPRSQSEAPLSRPPQYGPFTNAPGSVPSGSYAVGPDQGPTSGSSNPPNAHGFTDQGPDQPDYGIYRSSESLGLGSQLLGPGMPGSDLGTRQPSVSFRGRGLRMHSPERSHPTVPRSFTSLPHPDPLGRGSQSPGVYTIPASRPTSSRTSDSAHERDFSRTLPPLNFGSHHNQGSFSAPGPHSIHPSFTRSAPPTTTTSTFDFGRSSSPEPTFAYQPPGQSARSALPLPPPFTLQPPPQWDTSLLASVPRPQVSSWSRPSSCSTGGSAPSPMSGVRDVTPPVSGSPQHDDRTPRLEPAPPPARSGRYDPIRGTFISYTTPALPSSSSPARSNSERSDNEL